MLSDSTTSGRNAPLPDSIRFVSKHEGFEKLAEAINAMLPSNNALSIGTLPILVPATQPSQTALMHYGRGQFLHSHGVCVVSLRIVDQELV
jgi:hypothetical protein